MRVKKKIRTQNTAFALFLILIFCDPDWIRTNGLQLRRLLLYPAELPDPLSGREFKIIMLQSAPKANFYLKEPAIRSLIFLWYLLND